MGNDNYLIGRQPILNRNQEIVAYELLFRSPGSLSAVVEDASMATASVIINTLTEFGLIDILGGNKGFINLELELLMDDTLNILPKDHIVIELLETLKVTDELVERCRFLKLGGFTLALDDHEYSPKYHELYKIVDIVKVDLIQTSTARLEEMIKHFRDYPLQLLAEKVETLEEFSYCLDLGFDLFQGYYFAKPSIMEKKRLDDSTSTLLKLMRQLSDDVELDEIEKTFRKHVSLTYKLLLLVNSVGIGTRDKIDTVRHGISMLGRQQIKRWVQLALFAGSDHGGTENPLLEMAAVRAGIMEELAKQHITLKGHPDSGEKAYMTGILSILEATYNIPMAEMVCNLNLSEDVKDALLSRAGGLGKLLHVAELLEQLEFEHVNLYLDEMGITTEIMLEIQKKAYAWRRH